jgi:hypothetical protein
MPTTSPPGETAWARGKLNVPGPGQVEDSFARCGVDPLDRRVTAVGFAAGHDLVEPSFIGGRDAAEGARVQVLGGWFFQIKKAGAKLPPYSIVSR